VTKINRGKIELVLIEMYCQYCINWNTAKKTGYIDQEEGEEEENRKSRKAEGTRKCLVIGKEIELKTKSCINFQLCSDFWCNKNHNIQNFKTCMNRQSKQSKNCLKCKQGKLIKNFVEYSKEE
jgi:hypothetical protein